MPYSTKNVGAHLFSIVFACVRTVRLSWYMTARLPELLQLAVEPNSIFTVVSQEQWMVWANKRPRQIPRRPQNVSG